MRSTARRVEAIKWVENVDGRSGKVLRVNNSDGIFESVRTQQTNMISIFGSIREGKSFLMNCLSGERDVFRVSDKAESCTIGIHVSNAFKPLQEFSGIDGGRMCAPSKIMVGFMDAEGQNDKNVTYDARLVCPVLLASKCVIFNWKGTLQKDALLNRLGIMTRAASNVANEEEGTSRVFGHLHIVFRDWQFVDSTPEDVLNDIMREERQVDAEHRNVIRRDVRRSFESIQVWLFPEPSTGDKHSLTIDKTTPAFRAQVRQLRSTLSMQLARPTTFGGGALLGKHYSILVNRVADCLNRGEAVLPQSAYVAMMRDEVVELRARLEAAMREVKRELELQIRSDALRNAYQLPTTVQARDVLSERLQRIEAEFHEELADTLGELKGQVNKQVMSDFPNFLSRIKSDISSDFDNAYKVIFFEWLAAARKRAQDEVDRELARLEQNASLSDAELPHALANILARVTKSFLHVEKFSESEIKDAVEQLRHRLESRAEALRRAIAARSAQNEATLNRMLEANVQKMCVAVEKILQVRSSEGMRRTRLGQICSGFSQAKLAAELNSQYEKLLQPLQLKAQGTLLENKIVSMFRTEAEKLNVNIQEQYIAARSNAANQALRLSIDALDTELHPRLPKQPQEPGALAKFEDSLRRVQSDVWGHMVQYAKSFVDGWDWNEGDLEAILAPLQDEIRNRIAIFVKETKNKVNVLEEENRKRQKQRELAEAQRQRELAEAQRQRELAEAQRQRELAEAQRQRQLAADTQTQQRRIDAEQREKEKRLAEEERRLAEEKRILAEEKKRLAQEKEELRRSKEDRREEVQRMREEQQKVDDERRRADKINEDHIVAKRMAIEMGLVDDERRRADKINEEHNVAKRMAIEMGLVSDTPPKKAKNKRASRASRVPTPPLPDDDDEDEEMDAEEEDPHPVLKKARTSTSSSSSTPAAAGAGKGGKRVKGKVKREEEDEEEEEPPAPRLSAADMERLRVAKATEERAKQLKKKR